MRQVALQFRVPLSTVQYWVGHAQGQRLDRVEWQDRSCTPRHTQRTRPSHEHRVLHLRRHLRDHSALGEYGAAAIHRAWCERYASPPPSLRTIGRILERHGVLDQRRRVRRPPPPPGWYLPAVANRQAELEAFDFIEDLKIKDGPLLDVFTGISLHGGLPIAWPRQNFTARLVVELLVSHWRHFGLPAYAQFDNDTRFQGPHQFPDTLGRVVRLGLSLGIVPVFVPPRETGFQGAMESFNARWQAKVWQRFQHTTLTDVHTHSDRYLLAARTRHAARIEAAPPRRPFPAAWHLNLQASLRGTIIYLRRTNAHGAINILGHTFTVDPLWQNRLVRAEFLIDQGKIHCYALRRRAPEEQRLLTTICHSIPEKPFQE